MLQNKLYFDFLTKSAFYSPHLVINRYNNSNNNNNSNYNTIDSINKVCILLGVTTC